MFPIPWLNTIRRQRYVKNNLEAKQREKLITKIEEKYKIIDNYPLSKFFKKEIIFIKYFGSFINSDNNLSYNFLWF